MPLDGSQVSAAQALNAANSAARAGLLYWAVPVTQLLQSQTISGTVTTSNNVLNFTPRMVGLIMGFIVKVTATITNNNSGGGGAAITPTGFGPANILSRIQFTDLSNNVRINTSGWHLHTLNSVKRNWPYGSAVTLDTYPIDWDNNWTSMISATASIASTQTGTVNMYYWVPLAYGPTDTRGAIYANVVNATMQLQLTVNATPSVASGDAFLACYSGNGGATSAVTVSVYQVYMDQLPTAAMVPGLPAKFTPNGVVLPMGDLSTIYNIIDTNLTGLVVSSDFNIPYANYRDFLSTTAVFDNGGTFNVGSDINAWKIEAANFVNYLNVDPITQALTTRLQMGIDPPPGVYYFDHRLKPISTIQYGNQALILNPSTVNANASVYVGWESFAIMSLLSGAGTLPAG